MANLAQKLTTFFTGTHQEIISNTVEGPAWMALYYGELFADLIGSGVFKNSSSDIPKYVCVYLTIDGMTRLGKAIYKGFSDQWSVAEASHPYAPQAGIVGTVREWYKK